MRNLIIPTDFMTSFYTDILKRALDFVFALIVLTLCLPVFSIVAGLTLLFLGRPVFFRQNRPGLHGKIFRLLKFRTMTNSRDSSGSVLPDAERLTAFGRFLRKSSLDELPELWNVLRGDMSLVGPRPLLVKYIDIYTAQQARRHEVRPGITGWAQVNGRNNLSWEEKFELDVWYVDHLSFALDAKILFRTLAVVFACQGIHQSGHATVQEFTGTEPISRFSGRRLSVGKSNL